MDKFGRNYILLIEEKDGRTVEIRPPFTVEFDITRNSFTSANACQIRVYNLSDDNRSLIRKDPFDFLDQRSLLFTAGYGDNLSIAFSGTITQAGSVREGENIITTLESFDGGYGYTNAITADQFPSGTPTKEMLTKMVKSFPGVGRAKVKAGAVGDFPGKITRGNSFSGSTIDLLSQITGGAFFIDNGYAHCLNDKEALEGPVPVISAKNGLLGTPNLESQLVHLDMLFEPGLRVGQRVQILSETEAVFNKGFYKIISLKHRGIISEAVGGDAITSLGLLPGEFTEIGIVSGDG